jgi:hypothetical protein
MPEFLGGLRSTHGLAEGGNTGSIYLASNASRVSSDHLTLSHPVPPTLCLHCATILPSVEFCPCPSVFPSMSAKERDDYPTPDWVTDTVIPHLEALNITSIWEPAAERRRDCCVCQGRLQGHGDRSQQRRQLSR